MSSSSGDAVFGTAGTRRLLTTKSSRMSLRCMNTTGWSRYWTNGALTLPWLSPLLPHPKAALAGNDRSCGYPAPSTELRALFERRTSVFEDQRLVPDRLEPTPPRDIPDLGLTTGNSDFIWTTSQHSSLPSVVPQTLQNGGRAASHPAGSCHLPSQLDQCAWPRTLVFTGLIREGTGKPAF